MKDIELRLIVISVIIVLGYLFLSIIQQNIIIFEYALYPINESVNLTEIEIAQNISLTLWEQRTFDIILFALLLFITTVCCTYILRPQKD